jgi:RNA polymerase sigma-70 factor (ECF subfamily)
VTEKHDDHSDLLQRAQAGDEAALARLLERHSARLLDCVRSELGDRLRQRLESQDVMQQVFVDALRSIDRFEQRGSDAFFAWLRQIARNRICDVDRGLRTARRQGGLRLGDLGDDASALRLLENLEGSVTSPSMRADRTDQIRRLERALNELGQDQREAIVLRYFDGLDVAAAAAAMGRSERAVRGLCVRALVHLRELLHDGH